MHIHCLLYHLCDMDVRTPKKIQLRSLSAEVSSLMGEIPQHKDGELGGNKVLQRGYLRKCVSR